MKEECRNQQLPYMEGCTNPEAPQDRKVTVSCQETDEPVSIPFCKDGNAVESGAWAVSLRCHIRLEA